MARATGLAGKARYWLGLLRTARSGDPGIKLLAVPSFGGGPSTKAQQLDALVAKKGQPFGTVLALSAVRAPIPLLRVLRWLGVRILVNQNGVYYPAWSGPSYQAQNRYLRRINELAHHTFFQSEFARRSYEEWVGSVPKNASILFNGVDTDFFRPSPEANRPLTLLFFCDFKAAYRIYWHALFTWMRDPSFPLSKGEYRVLAVGNCSEKEREFLTELRGLWASLPVEFHVNLPLAQVPAVIQRCHVLVHLIYNDVCPNKVLEAMACGVWPICVSAGGTRELVGNAGLVLPVAEGYGAPALPTPAALSEALAGFSKERDRHCAAARKRAEQFALKEWQARVREQARPT